MGLVFKILFFIMCMSGVTNAQTSETVFVTVQNQEEKPKAEYFFSQISLGFIFTGKNTSSNSEYGVDSSYDRSFWNFITPNGLTAHVGCGVHLKQWVAVSANTGIDWVASEKLVAAPLYGSLVFSPKMGKDHLLYIQGGYGRSFALGRGNLSGPYYKGRLGLLNDDGVSIFVDISHSEFTINSRSSMGTVSIGLALLSF